MEVTKLGSDYGIKMKIPRYCNRSVWNTFFNELINVNADRRVDLQLMKNRFHDAIISDNKLEQKIKEFNRFLLDKSK